MVDEKSIVPVGKIENRILLVRSDCLKYKSRLNETQEPTT